MNSQNDFSVEKKYKSLLVQANSFPSRLIFFFKTPQSLSGIKKNIIFSCRCLDFRILITWFVGVTKQSQL